MIDRRQFLQDLARIGASGVIIAAAPRLFGPTEVLTDAIPAEGALSIDTMLKAIDDIYRASGSRPVSLWASPRVFKELCDVYEIVIDPPPLDGPPHLQMVEGIITAPCPDLPPSVDWLLMPDQSALYHRGCPVWPLTQPSPLLGE